MSHVHIFEKNGIWCQKKVLFSWVFRITGVFSEIGIGFSYVGHSPSTKVYDHQIDSISAS
jgi:hypothetical protein